MEILTSLFEGPEKKLEIILFSPVPGLRNNDDGRWEKVVRASRAEIITKAATDCMDSYLLSESSLFVWDDRILMITCGKTTLVQALVEILAITGRENVAFIFYEQKNFMFPHEQPSSFEDDVAVLTKHFPGKYYKIGPANYDHVNVFYSSHARARQTPEKDATLQILMHDLDPAAMKNFCIDTAGTPAEAEKISGLDRLYDLDMIMDGYLFSPCGYSLNGIREDEYFTVHVTPQSGGSYVSFESNIIEADYFNTIKKVISIFRPGRFSLVLTSCMDQYCLPLHDTVKGDIAGYSITDKSLYEFDCGYGVTFLNYLKTS